MQKTYFPIYSMALILLVSCSGGPSEEDLKKKILLEYVCMEGASVENLNVVSKKDAETVSGTNSYEYTVAGEVVWENGCDEGLRPTPPGFKEQFSNKKVFLANVEGEWR